MPRATISPEWRHGVWQVRLRAPSGSRPWFKLEGVPREREDLAIAAALELRELLRDGQGAVPAARGETVSEYAKRWLTWRRERGIASAIEDEMRMRIHIAPVLGDMPLAGVTKGHLEDFVTKLDEGVRAGERAAKTALHIWTTASVLFRDATGAKDRKMRALDGKVNPAAGVAPPDRGTITVKVYLHPGEFLKLVSCPKVRLDRARLYACAVYSYLREGELTTLRWEDVDLERCSMLVHRAEDRNRDRGTVTPKGNRSRRISFEVELLPMLVAMKAEATTRLVFPTPPSASGDYGVASLLRKDLIAAGVHRAELHTAAPGRKRMTFHDLRATGATWQAQRGDAPLRIQARLGHQDFRTTMGYTREAENAGNSDAVFPPLPARLIGHPIGPMATSAPAKHGESKELVVGTVGFEATAENALSARTSDEKARTAAGEVANGDHLSMALADAIRAATAAGQWGVVTELARIIDRRLGREQDPPSERTLKLLQGGRAAQ